MTQKYNLSEAAKVIAEKGGVATLKKYGKKHFKKMAEKRWAKSRSKAKKKK